MHDLTDLLILQQLVRDGRTPQSDLARMVGRSESTLRERLQKLQESGLLRGYHADVHLRGLGFGTWAIATVQVEQGKRAEAVRALEAAGEVIRVLEMTGGPMNVEVRTRDLAHLRTLLGGTLSSHGMSVQATQLVLEPVVAYRAPDLRLVAPPEPAGGSLEVAQVMAPPSDLRRRHLAGDPDRHPQALEGEG